MFVKDFFKSLKKRYHYAMVVFKELVKADFHLRYQDHSWAWYGPC